MKTFLFLIGVVSLGGCTPSQVETAKKADVIAQALILGGGSIPGCTVAQNAEWKKIGGLVAQQCAIPGAQQALVDVVNDASQPGATAQSVATAVAISDGVAAALCAADVFFKNAGDLVHAKLEPQDTIAVEALRYIQQHADELARKVEAQKAAR